MSATDYAVVYTAALVIRGEKVVRIRRVRAHTFGSGIVISKEHTTINEYNSTVRADVGHSSITLGWDELAAAIAHSITDEYRQLLLDALVSPPQSEEAKADG